MQHAIEIVIASESVKGPNDSPPRAPVPPTETAPRYPLSVLRAIVTPRDPRPLPPTDSRLLLHPPSREETRRERGGERSDRESTQNARTARMRPAAAVELWSPPAIALPPIALPTALQIARFRLERSPPTPQSAAESTVTIGPTAMSLAITMSQQVGHQLAIIIAIILATRMRESIAAAIIIAMNGNPCSSIRPPSLPLLLLLLLPTILPRKIRLSRLLRSTIDPVAIVRDPMNDPVATVVIPASMRMRMLWETWLWMPRTMRLRPRPPRIDPPTTAAPRTVTIHRPRRAIITPHIPMRTPRRVLMEAAASIDRVETPIRMLSSRCKRLWLQLRRCMRITSALALVLATPPRVASALVLDRRSTRRVTRPISRRPHSTFNLPRRCRHPSHTIRMSLLAPCLVTAPRTTHTRRTHSTTPCLRDTRRRCATLQNQACAIRPLCPCLRRAAAHVAR